MCQIDGKFDNDRFQGHLFVGLKFVEDLYLPQVAAVPSGSAVDAAMEFLRKKAKQLRTSICNADHIRAKSAVPTSLQRAVMEPGQYYRVFDVAILEEDFKKELQHGRITKLKDSSAFVIQQFEPFSKLWAQCKCCKMKLSWTEHAEVACSPPLEAVPCGPSVELASPLWHLYLPIDEQTAHLIQQQSDVSCAHTILTDPSRHTQLWNLWCWSDLSAVSMWGAGRSMWIWRGWPRMCRPHSYCWCATSRFWAPPRWILCGKNASSCESGGGRCRASASWQQGSWKLQRATTPFLEEKHAAALFGTVCVASPRSILRLVVLKMPCLQVATHMRHLNKALSSVWGLDSVSLERCQFQWTIFEVDAGMLEIPDMTFSECLKLKTNQWRIWASAGGGAQNMSWLPLKWMPETLKLVGSFLCLLPFHFPCRVLQHLSYHEREGKKLRRMLP